jgi:hypothetical protein
MRETDKPFIIAVPTNDLKNEVYMRMKRAGVTAKVTPEMPKLEDDDQECYDNIMQKGDVYGYYQFMKELSEKYDSVREYKEKLKEAMRYDGNIVTTHHRLLYYFREDILDTHTIIIDEDIITTMFPTDSVAVSQLEYLLSQPYIKGDVRKRLKYYMRKGGYMKHIAEPRLSYDKYTKRSISEDSGIDFNIYDFLSAKATVVEEDRVYYASLKPLPSQKLIILSATISEEVYAEFFKNRHIERYNIKEARYVGKIRQWSKDSFSRNWIENNRERFEEIRDDYSSKDCYVITFKRFENEKSDLHFGNTQGKDIYSDGDIVVLGTPFPNDRGCRLMAAAMDYNVEIINKDSLNTREVEYDRYRFYFSTFEDEVMKKIHTYYIYSELEQAVGRARLLNKDNTVYVHASFPVKQAEFMD